MELPAKKSGECTTFEDGKICLYRFRSGYCGVTFLVENKHTAPLVFVLDCSKSKNVVSHRPSLKHQQVHRACAIVLYCFFPFVLYHHI